MAKMTNISKMANISKMTHFFQKITIALLRNTKKNNHIDFDSKEIFQSRITNTKTQKCPISQNFVSFEQNNKITFSLNQRP